MQVAVIGKIVQHDERAVIREDGAVAPYAEALLVRRTVVKGEGGRDAIEALNDIGGDVSFELLLAHSAIGAGAVAEGLLAVAGGDGDFLQLVIGLKADVGHGGAVGGSNIARGIAEVADAEDAVSSAYF